MAMAASAADVRSILSLPVPQPSSQLLKKPAVPSARKPEGISRELYSLIGPSAPSLAAQLAKPRLKQKPNLGSGGKVKWSVSIAYIFYDPQLLDREHRGFKNSARSDSLELKHWVKASTDPNEGILPSTGVSLNCLS